MFGYNHGGLVFFAIFCGWPLAVHFAIVYLPRAIRAMLKRMPENPTND